MMPLIVFIFSHTNTRYLRDLGQLRCLHHSHHLCAQPLGENRQLLVSLIVRLKVVSEYIIWVTEQHLLFYFRGHSKSETKFILIDWRAVNANIIFTLIRRLIQGFFFFGLSFFVPFRCFFLGLFLFFGNLF